MIFLTGATGHVGLHVARAFEGRRDVRALAHSDRSSAILDDLGIDVVRGDLRDPEPLADAFAGVERLLLISPPASGHGEMELAALELAERSGVLGHVVKLSSIGVQGTEPALLSQPHVMVEERLGRGNYTSTFLRPASFMTNVMNNVTEIRDGKLLMPAGDARIPFIDPRDVADVAVLTLTAPERAEGPLVMTGPEALSFADLAAKLTAALGREIAYTMSRKKNGRRTGSRQACRHRSSRRSPPCTKVSSRIASGRSPTPSPAPRSCSVHLRPMAGRRRPTDARDGLE